VKLGSLFDGIGGFPLSAIQHGIEPVWASEIEPFPILVTKKHFPNMKHLGDITKINGAEIEPVEIITGGSPCQDLSIAGKRAGLAGERSGLFMEQVRIVKEMREHDRATGRSTKSIRPRFMVWENVPGTFSSNGGEDFRVVLEEIARIADETVTIPRPRDGKWNTAGAIMGRNFSIAWRVLDAQYWGVPQRRRRIFLVADFGGQSAPEILFKCKSMSGDIAEGEEAGQTITTNIGAGIDGTGKRSVTYGIQGSMIGRADKNGPQGDGINEDVSFTLNTTDRHGVAYAVRTANTGANGHGIAEDKAHTLDGAQGQVVATYAMQRSDEFKESEVSHTLAQRDYKDSTDLVVNTETVLFEPRSQDGVPRIHKDVVPTLNTAQGGQRQPCVAQTYQETVGSLCARDYKGIGNQYVNEDKCIVSQRYTVRRLTPTECERLQGFPDDWTNIPGTKKVSKEELEFWRGVWYEWDKMQSKEPEEVSPRTDKAILRWLKNPTSDTARYKALGNSVAVPCVTWIMGQIVNELRRNAQDD
jgi:DNA (cytosine-5)-methyltransferase 1